MPSLTLQNNNCYKKLFSRRNTASGRTKNSDYTDFSNFLHWSLTLIFRSQV
nr:MAG TPA: hypothetical protein [Caudoviricetes sp.]